MKKTLWILVVGLGAIAAVSNVQAEGQSLYNAHGKRDPFLPLVTLTSRQSSGLIGIENADDIAVEGVVYDPKNGSIVIVNGSVLQEGEELGSVKVLKINSDGVLFSVNGIEAFKTVYEEDKKQKNLGLS